MKEIEQVGMIEVDTDHGQGEITLRLAETVGAADQVQDVTDFILERQSVYGFQVFVDVDGQRIPIHFTGWQPVWDWIWNGADIAL